MRTTPFPPAHAAVRGHPRAALAAAAGAMACGLAHGSIAHGSIAYGSTATSTASTAVNATSPAFRDMQASDILLGDDVLSRASQLAPIAEFDACALLLEVQDAAIPCRELTDWTRTPGLGAWNCNERVHFSPDAAIRFDRDEGRESLASIALR